MKQLISAVLIAIITATSASACPSTQELPAVNIAELDAALAKAKQGGKQTREQITDAEKQRAAAAKAYDRKENNEGDKLHANAMKSLGYKLDAKRGGCATWKLSN